MKNQIMALELGRLFETKIEGMNVDPHELAWKLTLAGIAVEVNAFSFLTKSRWKLNTTPCGFDLISPLLENGIDEFVTVIRVIDEMGAYIQRTSFK
ncbi:hypothetical protein [Larkinella sp. GY13]|uniref:hypothetical protein n=1 Tax=Larkinella sp. GY13 TaxID=3453720 RepID=UPI003F71619F